MLKIVEIIKEDVWTYEENAGNILKLVWHDISSGDDYWHQNNSLRILEIISFQLRYKPKYKTGFLLLLYFLRRRPDALGRIFVLLLNISLLL